MKEKKIDIFVIIAIIAIVILMCSVARNNTLNKIANVTAVLCVCVIYFLGLKNKIEYDFTFWSLIALIIYNFLILFSKFSFKVTYLVFQELALILFAFSLTKIKISKENFEKISKILSYFYYCVLLIVLIVWIFKIQNILNKFISIALYKAMFAISFFPYIRTNKKISFCLISSLIFFAIGERTIGLLFLVMIFVDIILKITKNHKLYNSIFIIVMILMIIFINVYVLLANTFLKNTLDIFSNKIFGENFFSGRHNLWSQALESIKGNELIGLGFNNTQVFTHKGFSESTHNIYIWLIVNGGYLLLTLFSIFLFSIWKQFYKNKDDIYTRTTAIYFIGILVLLNFELLLLTNNFVISLFLWSIMSIRIIDENKNNELEETFEKEKKI